MVPFPGLSRDVCPRGDSMTVKLNYLAIGCADIADGIEDALDLRKIVPEKEKGKRVPGILNTELRAIERRTTRGGLDEEGVDNDKDDLLVTNKSRLDKKTKTNSRSLVPASPNWVEMLKRQLAEKQAQRKKMLEYAKAARKSSKMNGARSPGPISSKGLLLSKLEGVEEPSLDLTAMFKATPPSVSEWRKRIHSARRRVILIVLTIIRLKKGKVAERLQKIDNFAFFIPISLGDDYSRFLLEQENYKQISDKVAKLNKSIRDLEARVEEIETEDRPSLQTAAASLFFDVDRLAALRTSLSDEEQRLRKSELLLNMFIGRANSADQKRVLAPPQVEMSAALGDEILRADIIHQLKGGKIVFQLLASEDEVFIPNLSSDGDGTRLDLYTSDPWHLASLARPGSIPLSSDAPRIQGLSLGGRSIIQLKAAVEAVAGADAVSKLRIVLSLHEGQADQALTELFNRGHFGLQPQNVFITITQREVGYVYDKAARLWLKSFSNYADMKPRSLGTGYSLVKLASPSDAFTLDGDGIRQTISCPLIEKLVKSGSEWMVSRQLSDLSLLSTLKQDSSKGVISGGALDIDSLVKSLSLRKSFGATCTVQGLRTKSNCRSLESVLMSSSVSPTKKSRYSVLELGSSEIMSSSMVDALTKLKVDGSLVAGTGRYDLHLPSLATALSHIILRPKLVLSEGLNVHVSVPLSDITSHSRSKCFAFLSADDSPPMLRSSSEVESLIPLLKAQDRDSAFLKAAGLSSNIVTQLRRSIDLKSPSNSISNRASQRILVLCCNNKVNEKGLDFAARLSKPDDEIILLTVVDTDLDLSDAKKLLLDHHQYLQSNGCHSTIRIDVVIRGTNGLISTLESYVSVSRTTLVVASSHKITSAQLSTLQSHASVSLSLAAKILGSVPMVITTKNNTRQANDSSRGRKGSSIMVLVEPQSKPMVAWIASSCCDPFSGDNLVLACPKTSEDKVTTKQKSQAKRLVESLVDIAGAAHTSTKQIEVEGGQKGQGELLACAETIDAHFVALSLKADSKAIPSDTLMMIRSSKVPVMLFR